MWSSCLPFLYTRRARAEGEVNREGVIRGWCVQTQEGGVKRRGKGHVYTGVYLAVQDGFKNGEDMKGKFLCVFFFFNYSPKAETQPSTLLPHYQFSMGGEEQCSITGSQLVFSNNCESLPKQKVVVGKQLKRNTE